MLHGFHLLTEAESSLFNVPSYMPMLHRQEFKKRSKITLNWIHNVIIFVECLWKFLPFMSILNNSITLNYSVNYKTLKNLARSGVIQFVSVMSESCK